MFKKIAAAALKPLRKKNIESELKHGVLARVPLLRGADDSLIAHLAEALEPVKLPPEETVFWEGDPGHSLFLVAEGLVRVGSAGETIAELGPGACFGEGALIEDGVRKATVVTVEATTLFRLSRESFQALLEQHRKLRFYLRDLHEARKVEDIENAIERKLLKQAPFLGEAGSEMLTELARYLERIHFREGDILMREGEDGDCLYLIEAGLVRITRSGKPIAELGPGACVGEGALFDRNKRSATVTAHTAVDCFRLEQAAFRRIALRYTVFKRKLEAIHEQRST